MPKFLCHLKGLLTDMFGLGSLEQLGARTADVPQASPPSLCVCFSIAALRRLNFLHGGSGLPGHIFKKEVEEVASPFMT